jgi:hypothetical protein
MSALGRLQRSFDEGLWPCQGSYFFKICTKELPI